MVLSPSWPLLLRPQHQAVPSVLTVHRCVGHWPAVMSVTVVRVPVPPGPLTWTGVDESVVVLSPSWPLSLRPQHQVVPSVVTAQVCLRADADAR